MNIARKEKALMFVGLGMAAIGIAWFVLSIAGMLDGMLMMTGYFLGISLALCGLIIAFVYLYRWQRIRKLFEGQDVLIQWVDGESQVIIGNGCAFISGELYLWGIVGTRLEAVELQQKTNLGAQRAYLQISYGEMTNVRDPLTGSRFWRTKTVSVSIPEAQQPAIQRVVEQLRSRVYTG